MSIDARCWVYSAISIVSEVIATSVLEAAEGFTRWWPPFLVGVGYASAFYLLSLTLRAIRLGVAYAVWSGFGIALVSLIGWAIYLMRGLALQIQSGMAKKSEGSFFECDPSIACPLLKSFWLHL